MKRIRALTAAERALWAEVAATVKPRAPQEQTGPAIGETADAAAAALGLPEKTAPAPIAKPKATDRTGPVLPKTPPLAAIERKLKQRLSRGQREADAKIDLHGMRQDEAHAALHRFLSGAHARGASLVLVVTGKGGRKVFDDRSDLDFTRSERGVLHRLVPLWLADPEMRRFVIGFEHAAQGHGGSGALYVRIRRAR